jgi:simple sugar transport system ATP-binding protein
MNQSPVLQMHGIYKRFDANQALDDVSIDVKNNEIYGLLGGNGAGKTTLMNILYGLYKMDAGEISLFGDKVDISSPQDAIQLGIGMVHQHFLQFRNFSVLHNIVVGTRVKNRYTMNLAAEEKKIMGLCERFGMPVDLEMPIEELPMGICQKVEILKALYRGVKILILDEPTTNLTPQEVDDLFRSLRVMVTEGLSIVFITHKLREVMSVCDRISVLRNGKNILTVGRADATEEKLVKGMVGKEIDVEKSVIFSKNRTKAEKASNQVIVQVNHLQLVGKESAKLLKDISFEIHQGEIFGIAGVAGNGQRELAEALVGVQALTGGHITINGMTTGQMSSRDLFEHGVAYIPEDRLTDGFLPKANVAQNLILGFQRLAPYSRRGFINWGTVFDSTRQLVAEYNVKTAGPQDPGGNLSGGNIQRVMIARAFSQPFKFLVAHNATRGLDIPSMDFVYSRLKERKKDGTAILLISEDLDELLLLCDRMGVLFSGQMAGILERSQFEKYEIGRMMSGVRPNT